jgi:tetratricopeptide (TPR) repeat protein
VRVLLIVCVLALGLLASQGRASADARTEKAREHYVQGDAYYKLDKYSDALHEYEQAYIAKPDPSFLYNIAQCHRLMGDKPEAVKYYRRYLRDAPAAPNRAIAEKHIRELEAALNHGADLPPPDDGGRATPLPPPLPPPVASTPPQPPPPPPAPTPVTAKLTLDAPPPPPADSAPQGTIEKKGAAGVQQEPPQPFYTKWWFWTAVGAVAVGALVLALRGPHDPSCPSDRTACK